MPGPYQVICPTHGKVALSVDEYNRQMGRVEQPFKCPVAGCRQDAEFDDENWDQYLLEDVT